jgi:hypothetical protein
MIKESCFFPLSFSLEINAVIDPQRFTLPLKKRHDISSKGYSTHPVGHKSLLQIQMAVFKNLNLMGQVWKPTADYNDRLARFK